MNKALSGGLLLMLALLTACTGSSNKAPYPGVKVGKPYQIYGRWYNPSYDADYDEIGMASWYGPGFHGGKTANGERFDQEELTAAHRTLPLPSIVRVTNLNNGKSALVRINDRGPFARDRIIDLSKASATSLGIIGKGTAKVRVQFLDRETREYVQNSNNQGINYAMAKLKSSSPETVARAEQNNKDPKFYLMKVPEGQSPPPEAVKVAEQGAGSYPAHTVFAAADREIESDSRSVQAADSSGTDSGGGIQQASYISPQPQTSHSAPQDVRGGYYVQAGTFGVEQNARRLMAELSDFPVKIIESRGSRVHYRVVVGPYTQADAAKNTLGKLGALGIPDAKMVRN